jgi:hypothetical protein
MRTSINHIANWKIGKLSLEPDTEYINKKPNFKNFHEYITSNILFEESFPEDLKIEITNLFPLFGNEEFNHPYKYNLEIFIYRILEILVSENRIHKYSIKPIYLDRNMKYKIGIEL